MKIKEDRKAEEVIAKIDKIIVSVVSEMDSLGITEINDLIYVGARIVRETQEALEEKRNGRRRTGFVGEMQATWIHGGPSG